MRRAEHDNQGFVTIWVLGMVVIVLFLGGLTLDLWRAMSTQRAVSSAVDGAAVAGASGIDEGSYRSSGGTVVQLDPDRAQALAAENLGAQAESDRLVDVGIATEPQRIRVRAGRPVDFTLLKVFLAGREPLVVHATATVEPRRSS